MSNKIKVIIVEQGKAPRVEEISRELEAMQEIVGGYIEMCMPFDNDIAVVCNEEGKYNGLLPNRVVYTTEETNVSYRELTQMFREAVKSGHQLNGYIVFTEDTFSEEYSQMSRTYEVSSYNKAFISTANGYSIFGTSLDGTDKNVRLDALMADEQGGKNGWKIERCYTVNKQPVDVLYGTFFICAAPADSESFESLTDEEISTYLKMFEIPDVFCSR